MVTPDSIQLLREFAQRRSEPAFRGLVHEYSPMVLATALRQLRGDHAAAQDVAQEVFSLLARKADQLESVVLGAWLYRQTCRRAADHLRSQKRRRMREMASAFVSKSPNPAEVLDSRQLARELDKALLSLATIDRDALVLRFFENRGHREIGKLLGLSEDATRKRIGRALDRLGGILERKGITAGSVCLGTVLESFGATPVSAAMVSQFTGVALKVGADSGGLAIGMLLKPVLAGGLATSLLIAPALALRDFKAEPVSLAAPPLSMVFSRTSRPAERFPEHPTLEQIIAEIRRIRSSPGTTLTELKLKVALGKVEISQIPEFVALGNGRLNKAERQEIYQPLLTLWWERDPDAALTFILREKVDEKMQQIGSNYLLGELFRRWAGRDWKASEAWLMRHWNDESLRKNDGRGRFRNFLSMWITGDLFSRRDVDEVFAFSRRMPTLDDQGRALGNLVGMEPMHSIFTYDEANNELWKKFHRGLEQFPDESWRRELIRNFWKHIGENHPESAARILESLRPGDPFAASLGLLSVRHLNGKPEPTLSGGTTTKPNPVDDRDQRKAATMEIGLAHGMTRGQVVEAMARVLRDGMEEDEYFSWIDANRGDAELDGFLAAKARERGVDQVAMGGPQKEAIEWASRISDPDLRRSLCRAAFRRMLVRGPEFAAEYLKSGEAPEDLAAEFQQLAEP
jgi:RNA polymerase sigma factor (sigma-70 family)